uniref:Membrane-spanning 4-domains subfamily A member 4D-like n=1 Tax=Kryptolebias marmoratus TaxID=37003 RepID=A0A3Q3AVU8_KRYMA
MTVTVIRADGVTVFTVTSDPSSRWPPLCQILNSLCCSPGCCSVSENLRRVQKTSMSVLGFIFFGIMCILSEKFPSQCLVILNVILNLAGAAFAITVFSFYIISLVELNWNCGPYYLSYTSPDSDDCTTSLSGMLLKGINGMLIVLSVLEFCVVISAAILGIKALKNSEKKPNMDVACYKPLEEVSTDSAG